MRMQDECSSPLCVDLTKAAASHAQVVGVLAGFAVATIAVVLSRSADEDPSKTRITQQHGGIQALFVALFALIVASFMYGTAAGVEMSAQRAAAMTFAAGVVAAVAISNLAFGLVGLLAASAHKALTPTAGRFVALVVPLAGSTYVFVSAIDQLRASDSDEPLETWVVVILSILALLILISWICLLVLPVRARQRPLSGRLRLRELTTEKNLARASFALTGVALVHFLVLLYLPESASAVWVLPIMGLAWVTFVAVLFGAVVVTLRD
jgi:hypothetical protein